LFDNAIAEKHLQDPFINVIDIQLPSGINKNNISEVEAKEMEKYKYVVALVYHFRCTLHTFMSVRDFPFDRQVLDFKSMGLRTHWTWVTTMPIWVPKSPLEKISFDTPLQIRLSDPVVSAFRHITPVLDFSNEPRMLLTCRVERRSGYYIANVQTPLFLIVSCAFSAFSMPADQVSSRLGVSVTVLLAAVAFQFVVAGMLPQTSVLSYMSYFMLSSLGIVTAVIVENSAVAPYIKNGHKQTTIDLILGLILFLIWCFINVGFLLLSGRRSGWARIRRNEAHITSGFIKPNPQDILMHDMQQRLTNMVKGFELIAETNHDADSKTMTEKDD